MSTSHYWKLNWNSLTGDVNGDTVYLISKIDESYRKCFPVKIKYISKKRLNKSWLTDSMFRSIKEKSFYYREMRLGRISESYYKKYRNKLVNMIRRAKKSYFGGALESCKNDIKASWRIINKMLENSSEKKKDNLYNS